MRLLALAVLAMGILGASEVHASLDCLQASGPLAMITGDQGYKRFRETARTARDRTRYNAGDASWLLQVYPRPQRQAYPVMINGPDGGCWAGGRIVGTNDRELTWAKIYHKGGNSAALSLGNDASTTNFAVAGLRIHNAWDGVRIGKHGAGFVIRNVWITYNRDDCVENDHKKPGLISNSLFDGCFMGFSSRNPKSSYNGSRNVWTIEKTLVRLQPMPGPYKEGKVAHGFFFKWEKAGPKLRLIDNIFYVQQGATENLKTDPFEDLARNPGVLRESSGNVIVWAGAGAYRWPVPKGFTVTEDEGIWDNAKARWCAEHSVMAFDASGSPCGSAAGAS